ncbi:MAG TPA: hypothetical protein PKY77_10370 [Phycisphaerae bacterium]|nr:hypothetical protein [Phycisphaerae bacterium]HRY69983.1 hypothetical protein [Phycisphaerae bacterium]HSA27192.1 hypothetical protein [Phycisphaerae bacterium]
MARVPPSFILWFPAVPVLLTCGCLSPERASYAAPASQPATPPGAELAEYLSAIRAGEWVYERRELPAHADQRPSDYVRHIGPGQLFEIAREFSDLVCRYRGPMTTTQAAVAGLPTTRPSDQEMEDPLLRQLKDWTAIRIELGEPMDPIPPELIATGRCTESTSVGYGRRTGPLLGAGTLTRHVEVEDREPVECPAGRFEECLRVRVDLEIRFPLTPVIDWTTYVWLAPRIGEVRRVQSFSGWFLIFWFGSTHEYLLKSYRLPSDVFPPTATTRWSKVLVFLDRTFPHPRVAYMAVDLAKSQSASPPSAAPWAGP